MAHFKHIFHSKKQCPDKIRSTLPTVKYLFIPNRKLILNSTVVLGVYHISIFLWYSGTFQPASVKQEPGGK